VYKHGQTLDLMHRDIRAQRPKGVGEQLDKSVDRGYSHVCLMKYCGISELSQRSQAAR
jgi:hypothetical protein